MNSEEADFPRLRPTRSSDGKRSSVLIDVRGHIFQAVFVCLPTGELSEPSVHGTRADPMSPELRIQLETEARIEAMRIKQEHERELLAGMSVVGVDDLLLCRARAPLAREAGQVHRLEDWDSLTGNAEVPDPPRSHPVLYAMRCQGEPRWLFWGTLDVPATAAGTDAAELEAQLAQRLGAKRVSVLSVWLDRPEVLVFF